MVGSYFRTFSLNKSMFQNGRGVSATWSLQNGRGVSDILQIFQNKQKTDDCKIMILERQGRICNFGTVGAYLQFQNGSGVSAPYDKNHYKSVNNGPNELIF